MYKLHALLQNGCTYLDIYFVVKMFFVNYETSLSRKWSRGHQLIIK